MSSFIQKATPFFEYIVLGLAFAGMGYLFFWTFNNTGYFSILGMVAVCFGGLKILIGIIIYSGWLFALIFRPDYLKKKEEEERLQEAEKGQEEEEEDPESVRTTEKTKVSYLKRHWGTILEIVLLFIGLLIILITKS